MTAWIVAGSTAAVLVMTAGCGSNQNGRGQNQNSQGQNQNSQGQNQG